MNSMLRVVIWLNPAILLKALSKFHLFQSTELRTVSTKSLDQEVAQQATLCSGHCRRQVWVREN